LHPVQTADHIIVTIFSASRQIFAAFVLILVLNSNLLVYCPWCSGCCCGPITN